MRFHHNFIVKEKQTSRIKKYEAFPRSDRDFERDLSPVSSFRSDLSERIDRFYDEKNIEEMNMNRFSYYKVSALSPDIAIADPMANARNILFACEQLDEDCQLAVFPELCLSGYTAQDLFHESLLQKACLDALEYLCLNKPENLSMVVGLPLKIGSHLYNAAAFIAGRKVLGFQIKRHLPCYNEYYEPRWFASSRQLDKNSTVTFMQEDIPCSDHLLFEDESTGAIIGIEICEDLWVASPVSSDHAQAGANILVNCSASNDTVGKNEYRLDLVAQQSARCLAAYIYASAGPDESSMDLVFGGSKIIAENGQILSSSSLMDWKMTIQSEIDLQVLENERTRHLSSLDEPAKEYLRIFYRSKKPEAIVLNRFVDPYPFVPAMSEKRLERCRLILSLQARALATRLSKIHCDHVVIGISGGLDSTLALLVCIRAFDLLHLDRKGILAVTMPGFGTTSRTKTNAQTLMELLHVSTKTVPIAQAVELHFRDIDHDPVVHDITYENSQARERTQILMDLANQVNGLVIGTGDLSELALGWCTYNGDHMSMYAVNVSIPKTLVRYLVETEAIRASREGNEKLHDVLIDICETPVSPELLPPDPNGQIAQKTEETLGSYDLHDFFLYHMLRWHEPPKKIYALARLAFPSVDRAVILKALRTFYTRFFSQQFKRNVMPDGVKVGSVSFSPRSDWRMPSDASRALWMKEVEELEAEERQN